VWTGSRSRGSGHSSRTIDTNPRLLHPRTGRFAPEIEPIGWLRRGEEAVAVADYLRQLEGRIAHSPADAVAHLVGPCYEPRPRAAPAPRRAPARKAISAGR
jgi:hypothetical protein